ncbi:hypothetical protein BN903_74 [Halorubrum sp. AJ67]|nr:hypothetical protein BN903_74 [Halorubrum sp. AJ67]
MTQGVTGAFRWGLRARSKQKRGGDAARARTIYLSFASP